MTALDDSTAIGQQVDAAFHYGGLLIRAIGYLLVYAVADRYDCGPAILTGVLWGDLFGQTVKLAWNWRHGLLEPLGELVLIGIVYLMVRPKMIWPEDPAMRAILGLAAFGLIMGHIGGSALTRLGPSAR